MGIILKTYKSIFVKRFDKDGIIPYYSYSDFMNLNCNEYTFKNSKNINIKYFEYYYDNYKKDKVILFCHGIGDGHTAYLREIEKLCSNSYRVISLDYTGCDKSEGENMISVNQPTSDVNDLLDEIRGKLISDEEIIVVGHSLGAYTALNTISIHPFIKKAVIISGFYNPIKLMMASTKIPFKFIFNSINKYEKKVNPKYYNIDNINYLKNTNDKLLFIHSKDDQMVPYSKTTKYLEDNVKNDNINYLIVDNKAHNPNYESNALKYMRETFSTYGKLKTTEEKASYMKTRSIDLMTTQDDEVFKVIFDFIEEKDAK